MSKIENGGLDQYGAKPFEQQQFEQLALKGLHNAHMTSYMCMNVIIIINTNITTTIEH